jgi:TolB protein
LTGSIVFAHEGDIWVMNADGTERTRLTEDPAEDLDPAWSPTGTHIAFASDRGPGSGGNDIYVVEVESGVTMRLTTGGGIDEYPTWAPEGGRIAYACGRGRLPEGVANFEICVMNGDGSEQQQLTDADGVSDYPAWAPDGGQIAFMSTRGGWPTLPEFTPPGYEPGEFGEYDIYVMNEDGSDVRNVTDNGRESEQFPGWSADGEHLIFSRYGCLVAATVDASAEAKLTAGEECADAFPDWRR